MLRKAEPRLSTSKYYSKKPNLLYHFTQSKESYSVTLSDPSYMVHRTTKITLRSRTKNLLNIYFIHVNIEHTNTVTSNLTKISHIY